MNILTKYATKALIMLTTCAICLGGVFAFEISDIPYPLTRDQADTALDKNYSYALLADGTIRRTWQMGNKTIIIDFDSNTNEALLIGITYNPPVAKKDGIDDAHALGKDKIADGAKWDQPKDKAAKELISDTYGLTNARRKKLTDKAMLFYESNDKGTKVTRVSLFSHMPRNNRWVLEPIHVGSARNAMAASWSDEFIEAVYQDEARRQSATPKPQAEERKTAMDKRDTNSAAASATPKRPQQRVERRTAMGNRQGVAASPSETAAAPKKAAPAAAPVKKVLSEGREAKAVMVSTLPPAPDFLKKFGVENPEWWHYIALGLLALIVLFMILRSMAKAKQNAAQQKQFAKIVGGGRPLRK